MAFIPHAKGLYQADHIKLLRLVRQHPLSKLLQIEGILPYLDSSLLLALTMRQNHLHI
jgi:hypothetical protein